MKDTQNRVVKQDPKFWEEAWNLLCELANAAATHGW
jgi:hypothetical protein